MDGAGHGQKYINDDLYKGQNAFMKLKRFSIYVLPLWLIFCSVVL